MGKKIISSLVLTALVVGLGFGVFAARQTLATSNESNSNENHSSNSNKNVAVDPTVAACIKTAIGTREGVLKDAWTTYTGTVATAYATRSAALQAAWDKTTTKEIRTATKGAWKDFQTTRRLARQTFNRARFDAWKTYKSAAKTCKAPNNDAWGNSGLDTEPAHNDH